MFRDDREHGCEPAGISLVRAMRLREALKEFRDEIAHINMKWRRIPTETVLDEG
jgi:hypothetical protein